MEENQNGLREEGAPDNLPDKVEVNVEETTPPDQESAMQEEIQDPLAQEKPQESVLRADVDWHSLSDVPPREQKKTGKAAFFAIFGSVLLICLALLVMLLFVGENGIRIFRTLHTERVVYVREDDGTSGLLTPQEAADTVRKSTVTVSVRTQSGGAGIGSGFVYDANGHICTNYHVIEGALSVQVVLPDGNACDAEVVGYDVAADLAVLRVQANGLVPVTFGSSAALLVGDEVVAVGTPAGMMFAGTATFGRVSYTQRLLPVDDDGDGMYEKKILVIQTDTSVNPGNSGGPMADMHGHVVGVVVRKILNYNGSMYEGVGFAIPIDGARMILDAIIKDGSFTGKNPVTEGRSLLGVTGYPGKKGMWYYVDPTTNKITSSEIQKEGYHYMPADGVYVINVQGKNAQGKLFVGDVIFAMNGLDVSTTQDLIAAVNRYACGETVSLSVWRAGTELTVQIVLDEE